MTDPAPPSKWKIIVGMVAVIISSGLLVAKMITEMTWAAIFTTIVSALLQ